MLKEKKAVLKSKKKTRKKISKLIFYQINIDKCTSDKVNNKKCLTSKV